MAATKTASSFLGGPHDFQAAVVSHIEKFFGNSRVRQVPKRGGWFTAELCDDGIHVDNLGPQPVLELTAFCEAVNAVIKHGDHTPRGNAMGPRLGDPELPVHSVEGWVAKFVYGQSEGETVFRRITPLVRILQAAGVFKKGDGPVSLTEAFKNEIGIQTGPANPRTSERRRVSARASAPRGVGAHR
jgi:hypothetical protein